MSDSLRPAALLADRLGGRLEVVLPDVESTIDEDTLTAVRIELRQVAGLASGGSMELGPGRWDFGPVGGPKGRLGPGQPDQVGFTLTIDDGLDAVLSPGRSLIRLDGEPVVGATEVAGRMIDTGSARFVLARPRPARRRSGGEVPPGQVDPWILDPIPLGGVPEIEADRLVGQRWRSHLGADGLTHRIESGRSHLWHRRADHPQFGTAMVGVADLPVTPDDDPSVSSGPDRLERRVAVPISIDALDSSTVLTGPRTHQLALARQIILSLAATAHPRDLRIGLQSELPDLAFVRDLPHAGGPASPRRAARRPTLLIIDQDRSVGRGASSDGVDHRWPVLADGGALLILGRSGDLAPRQADWLTIGDASTMRIEVQDRARTRHATPVGLGPDLAADLAERLSTIEVDAAP